MFAVLMGFEENGSKRLFELRRNRRTSQNQRRWAIPPIRIG
jgi:hypothetical protein